MVSDSFDDHKFLNLSYSDETKIEKKEIIEEKPEEEESSFLMNTSQESVKITTVKKELI